ncbi:MAG: ATP-binding protein [Planctomycetota bacterium]
MDTAHNLLQARIVYWGPAGSGKTSTLAGLRRCVDPEDRSRLYSVASAEGSTLFFDMLPIEDFNFGSVRVRTRLFAVPGGLEQSAARRSLLAGADAVVLVIDSRPEALDANCDSIAELDKCLRDVGLDLATIPLVCSFNKRDEAEVLATSDLHAHLGHLEMPTYETIATEGAGVFESFSAIFRLMIESLTQRHGIQDADPAGAFPARLLPQLLRSGVPQSNRASAGEDRHLLLRVPTHESGEIVPAVESQILMAEAHVAADATAAMLQGRNHELMAINRVARSILSAMEVDNLLMVLLDASARYLEATHASCVVFEPSDAGSLRTHVLGFGRDPVLGIPPEPARVFFQLTQESDGPIPVESTRNPELLKAIQEVDGRIQRAIFQPIKGNSGTSTGWIGIYSTRDERTVNTQGLLFLSSISRFAALGLEKIRYMEALAEANASLEEQVQDRTGKLEMAQARVRALNRGMESRVDERTRALSEANRALKEETARTTHQARLRGMGQLAASFAHEVNNPLSGLSGNLQYMRESLDELRERVAVAAPEASAGLEAIREFDGVIAESIQSAERVTALIGSLKRFGGEGEARQIFQLNAAVADAITLLEERLKECARLDLRLASLPEIHGDPLELSHVVLAVVTNGVEALEREGESGEISITTFGSGDFVTLVVKDSGAGMEEAMIATILEPFVSTKEGEPGAGLGLHHAYQAVRRHGGTIKIRSKPSEGTAVNVELPIEAVWEIESTESAEQSK